MPSPLAHTTIAYLIYRKVRHSGQSLDRRKIFGLPLLLVLAVVFSLLPDLDSVLGIVMQDFGRFHNNGSHSLLVGLAGALVLGFGFSRLGYKGFRFWFLFFLVSYELHVLMDAMTYGRGVMLFWPFSTQRFISPLLIFYGFHWSDGLFSLNHIVTLVTELAFAIIAVWLFDSKSLKNFRSWVAVRIGARG